ncbi:arginine ABC transporter permease ArtM [Shewanella sp. SNU WT4]|uniref:arginine ABC transporter permease ArtM n=1 Tax=Shewanella sp. SNU WT4 TaxID=2590015 RepID=UPI001F0DCDD5|nr:arginine ABC transporter permease ArtM [Shewanella sp. SNU WT4]
MSAEIINMLINLLEYLQVLGHGLVMTLGLTAISLLIGSLLALLCTLALTSSNRLIYFSVKGYITVFTGTPLLVQIFLIYYGPGQFAGLTDSVFWYWLSEPFFCAALALSLNCAAYTTLLFYGALNSINQGQWDSCASLGMSHKQTLSVLMPYALRRALPAYSNEVVLLLKGSSLASTITIMDIMGWAQRLNSQTYDTLVVFSAAGLLYLSLNLVITLSMSRIEKRVLAFEQA